MVSFRCFRWFRSGGFVLVFRVLAHATMDTMKSYAASKPRLSKENLYMVLAVWMESFTDDEQSEDQLFNEVGAVLVLPDDTIYAIDCSRNGVHAVARLIMAHPDILQNCKIFVSRKPCSFCTKLLVQAKVERVFYLPIEPEYFPKNGLANGNDKTTFETEKSRVDNLFKVSPISQNIFVPKVGSEIVKHAETECKTPQAIRDKTLNELKERYWNDSWSKHAKEYLPWPSFDEMTKSEVSNDFEKMMKWMATVLVKTEKGYSFELKGAPPKEISFNPAKNKNEGEQANHFITLAKFLAQRTDDPKTGVGAVIINKKKEVVGLGWNGFPKKARYGEFARASHKDEEVEDRKYPYIIHAEQNALMMRNTKNIEGGTLFVTKTPCDECTPLLEMQGIKTVVLSQDFVEEVKQGISYKKFPDRVEKGKFSCFFMKRNVDNVKRKLEPGSENEEKPGPSSKKAKLSDNQ